jgi:predicted kinase
MSTPPSSNSNHSLSNSITAALNLNHFDAHDEEGEIQVLLLKLSQIAKQRLEQGEQKLLQAKKRDQEYIDFCKRYTATQQKLSVIFAEIQKQLGVIKRLVLSLGAKTRTLLGEIEKVRQYQEQCIDDLKNVLDMLQQKPLHAQLVGTASTHSMSSDMSVSGIAQDKRTLFDFVNIESVSDLQLRAENELQEMRNIEALGLTILQQVDEQFRDITQSSAKLFETNEDAMSFQHDFLPPLSPRQRHQEVIQTVQSLDISLNNAEIKAMGNIVLEIAGHFDRLKHVLRYVIYIIINCHIVILYFHLR